MPKHNVLFLCTGNSARSQMAEGLLRHYGGDRFEVYSAGIEPSVVHPLAIRAMQEIGLDISGHRSKSTKEFMGRLFFRYLITVCGHADANCPQALWAQSGTRLHWPFDDPAAAQGTEEERLAKFRQIRDEIDAQVRRWLKELDSQPASQ